MQNTYIPNIFKDKLSLFFNYFRAFLFMLISLFFFISLLTFDINDNSFLTTSSGQTNNIFGPFGAYLSSFILYTFGLFSYGIVILFFSINSPSLIHMTISLTSTNQHLHKTHLKKS